MAEEKTADLNSREKKPEAAGGKKLDIASLIGITLAVGGLIGGLLLEGGKVRDIAQFTAALIVLGGTAGAVLVSVPLKVLKGGLRRLAGVFFDPSLEMNALVEEIIHYATKARKNGLVSLEEEAMKIEDPFLSKALNLAVDGTDLQEIRKMLELEIELEEQQSDSEAKVFECAGGYAPTIGIIGAVMGLIQVMKNLANIDEVGHGIAVSFVATVYGVGSANLLFLPAATKIKARAQMETQRKELILEGVSAIVEGLNPKIIRLKLEAYACPPPSRPKKKEQDESKPAEAPVTVEP
jgi:chemotaxis protein MotA